MLDLTNASGNHTGIPSHLIYPTNISMMFNFSKKASIWTTNFSYTIILTINYDAGVSLIKTVSMKQENVSSNFWLITNQISTRSMKLQQRFPSIQVNNKNYNYKHHGSKVCWQSLTQASSQQVFLTQNFMLI